MPRPDQRAGYVLSMRNPVAKALRYLKPKVVRPKKGKGSYRRNRSDRDRLARDDVTFRQHRWH